MFYLTTHSTHFFYGYMASDIWLRTILIVRKETRCRHIGYSFRLKARVLLYAPSHRQDSTYHGLCFTSRGSLAGTRNTHRKDNRYYGRGCTSREALDGTINNSMGPSEDLLHHERGFYDGTTYRYLVCGMVYIKDPLHHERRLYDGTTSRSLVCGMVYIKDPLLLID